MKRVWRLLMRVLFLKPKRQPIEVAMRLNQYSHERELRLVQYGAAWERRWQQAGRGVSVSKARPLTLWRVK